MDRTSDLDSVGPIKVHLLTENRLLRELIGRVLARKADIRVAGMGSCLKDALAEISASACEILLTDCLTTVEGETLISALSDSLPEVRVVLFGMHDDPRLFIKAAFLGVAGYVLKDVSASELVAAVRGVAHGEAVCPPKLCMGLIRHLAKESRSATPYITDSETPAKPVLTHRQRELVALVARGLTNKEIAVDLNLSEFTVKNHLRRIMKQVDARNRHDAVDVLRASGSLPAA